MHSDYSERKNNSGLLRDAALLFAFFVFSFKLPCFGNEKLTDTFDSSDQISNWVHSSK